MSKSKNDPVNEFCFQKDLRLYGESRSYNIKYRYDKKNQKKATLVPNHRYLDPKQSTPKSLNPGTKDYIFVIVLDHDMKPRLRIGEGSHYFLANKNNRVIAAGTISFVDNQIDNITDVSGTFHVDFQESTGANAVLKEEKERYRNSFIFALKQVGLPVSKFKPFVKLDCDSDLLGLSSKRIR